MKIGAWLAVLGLMEYAGLMILYHAAHQTPIVYAAAPSWVPPAPVAPPRPYEWMTIDADVPPPYDIEIAMVMHCEPPTLRRCTAWVRRR